MLASGSGSSRTSFHGLGGYWDMCLSSRFPQHSVFWRGASNCYGFRDRGPFDLCFCHHKVCDVSTWGLRLLEANGVVELYIASTMVASGGVASVPGTMVSAWGRGGGFLYNGRRIFFSSCCVWFFSFPGPIS
jgi:hypothetical protein